MVEGHLQGGVRGLVRLLDAALQQDEDVVSQHGDGEAEQGRAWMTEAAELAVQRRFEPLEHALHAPPSAVELGDLSRVDPLRQVAPQPDHALARLGRRVQSELDAPPGFERPGQLDPLLAHRTGLAAAAGAPGSLYRQLRVAAMLAHQEAGLRGLPAQQNRSRAELPIGNPQLLRLSAVQQVSYGRALALVRDVAGWNVGDQPAIWVVDHQRVSRQSRFPQRAVTRHPGRIAVHREQHALSGERRHIVTAPRKRGAKSRVVEVVHVQRDGAQPRSEQPRSAAWGVRVETWPEGFRAKSPP